MKIEDYQWQSDFAIEHQALGEIRGEKKALLNVLKARGIVMSADLRKRISECTDLDQLEHWVQCAATADKIGELFD
ncbi:hypothetical protein [Actinomadura roseirufa]|uniref:hypothetical protein n=1 Tax=Actinomadura roseirufa TaxID=2094049 RepID=UPI001041715B|nr:hypothetical protein [Actinomadura roseirufa]